MSEYKSLVLTYQDPETLIWKKVILEGDPYIKLTEVSRNDVIDANGVIYIDKDKEIPYVKISGKWYKVGNISSLVEDTNPQLGGDLNTNGNNIFITKNNKLYLSTDQTNLDDSSLIRLQWLDNDGKPAIGWFDKNGNRQSAIVTHDYLSYPNNRHQHFSIETSDNSGGLRTRLSIPWGSDKIEMSIHDADFSIADGCNFNVGQNSITKVGGDVYLYGSNVLGVGDKDWDTEGLETGVKWEFYRKTSKAVLMIHQDDGTSKAMLHLRRGTKDWQIINEGNFSLNVEGNSVLNIDDNGNFGVNSLPISNYKFYINGIFGFNLSNSTDPVNNKDIVFELVNDTTLKIKIKGNDGTIRQATIMLS